MRKAAWIAAAVLLAAALAYPKLRTGDAGGGGGGRAGGAAATSARGERPAAPLSVAGHVARAAPFVETVSSTGTLRAEEAVELQAETGGRIVRFGFVEGAAVRRGDVLVKLNDADLRAELARYASARRVAAANERRLSTLLEQRLVTRADYDQALGNLDVQQAMIDLYRAQIDKTEIRAPFDGVVGLRYVSVGAYVDPATRIATLQRLERLKIDFAIPERYATQVAVGAPIRFTVTGSSQSFDARIEAIDPRIDSATRTLAIRALSVGPRGALRPGGFARVVLEMARYDAALLVPAEAIAPGADDRGLFIASNGVASRRRVEIGARTGASVQILSGLRAGEVVITSGLQQLRDGQAVDVTLVPPAGSKSVPAGPAGT